MTDRQRAFMAALAYIEKNGKFTDYHRLGVKRLPQEVIRYEFRGTWKPDFISIYDDLNIKINGRQFFDEPWGVEISWQGSKRTEQLKYKSPKGVSFHGEDGEFFKFTGRFYSPDKFEIRDYSQDLSRYVYRVIP